MKKSELKKLTKQEALKNVDKLKKDLFNFRFQKINSQITNPSKINETKKTIARLKTLLRGKLKSFIFFLTFVLSSQHNTCTPSFLSALAVEQPVRPMP